MLVFSPLKNLKNSTVAMAMQRFFEFFRRKNYSALWHNLLNRFYFMIKLSLGITKKSHSDHVKVTLL